MGTARRNVVSTAPVSGDSAGARVLTSALSGIPGLLERFGVRSEPVMAQFDLTSERMLEPHRAAGYADMSRLIGVCARKTRCEHFGFLLGSTVHLNSLGIIGRLAKHAPSAGMALRGLSEYFFLHDDGATLEIRTEGDSASFDYLIHAHGVEASAHVYDMTVAAMFNVMVELCGPSWRPALARLPRTAPRDAYPYHARLRCPVEFNSCHASLVFARRWLAQPVQGADSMLYDLILKEVRAEAGHQERLLAVQTRQVIADLLRNGRCSRHEVADHLGLHERTLCRCLQSCGTTFQYLLDDTRCELAQQLLHDTTMPIARIADSLGYRNPTVLARAFRRWTGMSPRRYRDGATQLH